MAIDYESVARSIAETIARSGNAKAIFGEPIKLETCTIVPVVAVTLAVGGGGGHLFGGKRVKDAASTEAPFGGSGGGGELNIVPLGFISEKNGEAVFTPIESPVASWEKVAGRGLDARPGLLRGMLRKRGAR